MSDETKKPEPPSAWFKYLGEAPAGSIKMFGVAFEPNGAAVQLTDPRWIEKARGNKYFVECDAKGKELVPRQPVPTTELDSQNQPKGVKQQVKYTETKKGVVRSIEGEPDPTMAPDLESDAGVRRSVKN